MEGGEGPPFPVGQHQYENPSDFNSLPVEIPATQNQDVDATNAGINEEQPAPHAAKERCQQDCRITVTPDDMLWAVRNLGFNDYLEPLTTFLSRLRDVEGEHYTA
ncbi:Nuclear transcription factor Y subunit B-6 [Senna tora]|uniref:Nuclear transcription factor Y subunit B-6 n=1 Tax=Senna tora TaxID=362788 RepID=A0A834WHC3_9FABA|nr:Nuclear transcription factor Y subunit B-6 [Senna tora]